VLRIINSKSFPGAVSEYCGPPSSPESHPTAFRPVRRHCGDDLPGPNHAVALNLDRLLPPAFTIEPPDERDVVKALSTRRRSTKDAAAWGIPYEIAKARNHPHQDAIGATIWVSLFTLGALWPFLWIWAMAYRPERGWGVPEAAPPDLTATIAGLERRIAALERPVT
jgi:hypothetical protein